MNIFEKITRFVERVFKTSLEIFLEALKLSPNAQGYVSGSITELLLKKKLEEEYGIELKRIKEKWEGKKHLHHHGDYYFRKNGSPYWYVIESKGVKSNLEKWHRLYNFENLKNFLIIHADKISWIGKRGTATIFIGKEVPATATNTEFATLLLNFWLVLCEIPKVS